MPRALLPLHPGRRPESSGTVPIAERHPRSPHPGDGSG